MDLIKNNFKNPPSEYRTAPFWSWNGVMEKDEIAFQLRDFKAHGMGGAFAHPRLGMVTEYLSEDFFRAFGDALDTVKEEDMKLYMYDENAWPSGMAGGLVGKADISTRPVLAKLKIVEPVDPAFGGKVIFAAEIEGNKIGKVLTEYPKEEWCNHTDKNILVVYYFYTYGYNSTGGYPYPDVTNPRTVELFLKLTHEEYYKRFGADFGTYIPAVFSDETNIERGENYRETIPFPAHLEKKFEEVNGYKLEDFMIPCVFGDYEGIAFPHTPEKIRYDYYYTLHELWIDNFVKPIAKWCEDHNIAWTGHDLEHVWPQAAYGSVPSEMTTYEFRQMPGWDLLLCEDLRNNPVDLDIFQMYEVRSAANQFGHKRTICEAYGAGGYHSTMYDYKRLGDFVIADGINLICQHLSLYSYLGERKRDCPQSFDYRQPWWGEYTDMANYFGRASYIMAQGKMEQRILILNPSTSSYVIKPSEAGNCITHATDVNQIGNPDMSDFLTVIRDLTYAMWDFDIGDEYSMSRHAKVENGKLRVGKMLYDTVLVSKNMTGMRKSTVKLLLEFAAAGGVIVTTDTDKSEVAKCIEGEYGKEETDAVRAVMTSVATGDNGADNLCAYFDSIMENRVKADIKFPKGVQHMRKVLDDGREVYFFVNHSMKPLCANITLKGECAARWNLYTGEASGIDVKLENGYITFPLELEHCGTALIVVGDDCPVVKNLPKASENAEMTLCAIEMEEDNCFNIDHVVLEGDGLSGERKYFIEAGVDLYRAHGFNDRPWKTIQPQRIWVDNNNFDESTSFTATYSFNAEYIPSKLTLTVESPELWHVLVNGTEVTPFGKDSLDRGMGIYDISDIAKVGENKVVLKADKFDIMCEIEALFLRGHFAVEKRGEVFVITEPKEAKMGSWGDFGYKFYPYGAKYVYKTTFNTAPTSARLVLPEFTATIASVEVNGTYAGFVGMEGGNFIEIGKYLSEGENEIKVRVAGSMRNLLGPHIAYNDAIPYDWSLFERGKHYTADDYSFTDYGLYKDAELFVSEK